MKTMADSHPPRRLKLVPFKSFQYMDGDLARIEAQICERASSTDYSPSRVMRADEIPYARLDRDLWPNESLMVKWWSAWVVNFLRQPAYMIQRQIETTAWLIRNRR